MFRAARLLITAAFVLSSALACTSAGEIDLVLENASGAPVDIMSSNFGGHPGWFTVSDADGNQMQLLDSCGTCNCADLNACAICAMALPEAETLEDGESKVFHWIGTEWQAGFGMTQPCEEEVSAGAGPFTVEFCWGEAITTNETTELDPATITCQSAEFSLGADNTVNVVIQ